MWAGALSLTAALAAGCGGPEVRPESGPAAEELEDRGRRAEAAGNSAGAFRHYVAALQALPEDAPPERGIPLREKIIRLARSLGSPPAVPPEARIRFQRGEELTRNAPTPLDYALGVREFERGLRLAPWDAQANYRWALMQESLNNYEASLAGLRLYLLAGPDPLHSEVVRAKLAFLERKRDEVDPKILAGRWRLWLGSGYYDVCHERWERRGDEFFVSVVYDKPTPLHRAGEVTDPWVRFRLEGRKLTGALLDRGRMRWYPDGRVEATLHPDIPEISIKVRLSGELRHFVYRRE